MQVAVDISLYPLDEDFIPPIKNVIERLEQHTGVEVECNRMSTQLRGQRRGQLAVQVSVE